MTDKIDWIEAIRKERVRQVEEESWTAKHDDEWLDEELADAAACYASSYETLFNHDGFDGYQAKLWPWDKECDKRRKHSRKRQLVIAAALIVAELERLERAEVIVEAGLGE